MSPEREKSLAKIFAIRVVLIIVTLGVGVFLFIGLAMMKEPPKAIDVPESVMNVEVVKSARESVPVIISGYGQARSLNEVSIAPEVAGLVAKVHPRLELGELIPAGEVLFEIDQRDYQSRLAQASAQVVQAENMLERMKSQYQQDRSRLDTIGRSRNLARGEFERIKTLFENDEVGTRSGVEKAEMGFNEAQDAYDRLNQAVTLYPNMVAETESSLASAQAQLEMAQANLQRTVVTAPFNARIKMAKLEAGQYARPGEAVLVLADDSVLEISVPIDSRDARSWLAFENEAGNEQSWFNSLKPVTCSIRWTEDKDEHVWQGTLDRVESLDQASRTLSLAVRVDSKVANEKVGALPLVDGMFCEVEIPGKVMENVFRLPRWAVTYEGEIYIANADSRLEKRKVEVLRTQGEESFVSSGLEEGEQVIVTRLQGALPNMKLSIKSPADADSNPVESAQ